MRWCFIIIFILMSPVARAELKWDKRDVEFHPSLNETNVVAKYVFENVGQKTVKILSIKSSILTSAQWTPKMLLDCWRRWRK